MKPLFPTLITLIAVCGLAQAKTKQSDNSLDEKGTVQRFLTNPEGDVDGFLLENGTQVNFPPHMSSQLTAIVAVKDKVDVKGFRESAKVFKAESITNVKTEKSVVETPPPPPAGGPDLAGNPPPPPPPGPHGPPGGPLGGPGHHAGLQQLSASGKIENQLFGHRGEVNGVVLSDGTVVRFGPRLIEDSKVKTDVGQNIRASGFGTKGTNGQSLEATELFN